MKFLKKNFLKVVVMLTIVCFLSDFGFRFFNITKANDSYSWIYMLMFFLMVTIFRKDIHTFSEGKLNHKEASVLFWATIIVLNLFYILQRSFVLWRYFV